MKSYLIIHHISEYYQLYQNIFIELFKKKSKTCIILNSEFYRISSLSFRTFKIFDYIVKINVHHLYHDALRVIKLSFE